MVTKKHINANGRMVVECIEALKQAHKSPKFKEKTEKGTTIIIKFIDKFELHYYFDENEYSQFKELEARLWK